MGVRNVRNPHDLQVRVKGRSGESNSDDAPDGIFVSDFRKPVPRNKRSQVTLCKCYRVGPCALGHVRRDR